jgi:hypothetical protein
VANDLRMASQVRFLKRRCSSIRRYYSHCEISQVPKIKTGQHQRIDQCSQLDVSSDRASNYLIELLNSKGVLRLKSSWFQKKVILKFYVYWIYEGDNSSVA